MSSTADEAMSRYAMGDRSAFDAVYEEVAPRLERHLRRRVRQQARIDDIIQQTFLQMHSARGTFVIGAQVLPWAFAIARRLTIDLDRKARREARLDVDGDGVSAAAGPLAASVASGEEMLEARQAGASLAAALDGLSEPQRAAFELVKTEGLSHAQAALVLGTSVTGIKLRVHRAYLALRRALGEPRDAAATTAPAPAPAPHRRSSATAAPATVAAAVPPVRERR